VIECYLAELSRELRVGPLRRRRILAEVEAHLRDAGGDEDAIARFGSPGEVAARFNELHRPAPVLTPLLLLAGVVGVFGAVQGLESHIPPAPWPEDEAPAGLGALFDLATVCYLVAIVLALAALVVRRTAVALAACGALGTAVALLAVHALRRADLVPGSPPSWQLLLITAAALTPPSPGRRSRCDAPSPERSLRND
jgi:hypothetical protein